MTSYILKLQHMEKHNIKKLIVTQSNHLVEASYRLRLDEKRLVLAAISKIDSRNKVPDEITITALEFSEMFKIDKTNAYRQLENATDQLYERDIRINEPDKERRTRMRWVQKVVYEDGAGMVRLQFINDVKPYLSQLKSYFTSYKLIEVKNFSSGHSIRLYELLMQFKKTGIREIGVDWLREYLGIAGRYPRFGNFRQWVIQPAINEINTKSNIEVEWTPIKRGRTIHAITFNFFEKQQRDLFSE